MGVLTNILDILFPVTKATYDAANETAERAKKMAEENPSTRGEELYWTRRPSNEGLEELIGQTFSINGLGFIRVIDYMGDDRAVCQAARVSYGAGTKSVRQDKGLVKYLLKHGHWSPFEMAHIKLHVKLPIFVARQWIRHKFHLNEYSARYSELTDDNYKPDLDEIGKSSSTNKQGTDSQGFTVQEKRLIQDHLLEVMEYANENYHELLRKGVSREVARVIKPVGGYTEWYMETNLRDLMHFIRQRSDSHAQPAIRKYSDFLRDKVLKVWCPWSYEAFVDYIQNAHTLSGSQLRLLREHLTTAKHAELFRGDFDKGNIPDWISKKDSREVVEWFRDISGHNNHSDAWS